MMITLFIACLSIVHQVEELMITKTAIFYAHKVSLFLKYLLQHVDAVGFVPFNFMATKNALTLHSSQ